MPITVKVKGVHTRNYIELHNTKQFKDFFQMARIIIFFFFQGQLRSVAIL